MSIRGVPSVLIAITELVRRMGRRRPVNAEREMAPVLWFTGYSGSGKSTVAKALCESLKEQGVEVEYLDGDEIRSVFPSTGFSRSDRDQHLRRVGFLASKLSSHGVTVVASFVSPYRDSRDFVRSLCPRFIEIHVCTPLEVCEARDVKGLYARARAGEIQLFTGISDPYEAPVHPEIAIDTSKMSLESSVTRVLEYLKAAE